MSELKSCPICGDGEVALAFYGHPATSVTVECRSCGSHGPYISGSMSPSTNGICQPDVAKAIDAWNTRANGWISVEDERPKSDCLVYLKEPSLGRYIHSASYGGNISTIGHYFDWDVGQITHWQPLPGEPNND